MEQSDLYSLEARIDALIQLSKQLAEENQTLRETQANLMSERAALLEKNALARTRIETMITRLKSMEVGT
jgi:cell division protein ZapB